MSGVWPRIVIDESIPPDTFELRDPVTDETLLVIDTREGSDQRSYLCWRCGARATVNSVGLCKPCVEELR